MSPTVKSQIDILKRIVSRGMNQALDTSNGPQIDLWDHIQSELDRLEIWMEEYK